MRTKNEWELNSKPLRNKGDANTPHKGDLPEHPPEFYQFKPREGVHTSHPYRRSVFKRGHVKNSPTTPDVVLRTRTKEVGRVNKNGWRTCSPTNEKVQRKVKRARKWIEKNGHLF